MTRLIYPLELKDILEDDDYQPPFVKLIPKTKRYDSTNKIEVEVEVAGTKQIESLPEYKEEKERPEVEVTDVGIVTEIILPMPPSIVNSLSNNFQSVEGMGMIQKGVGKYLKWKAVKALGSFGGLLPQEIVLAIKSKIQGGAIDNPHEKLLPAGHNRRSFNLTYENLKPTSSEEEAQLRAIIDTLKYCSIGSYGDYVVFGPPSFDIEFHSVAGNIILQYENCKIANFDETMGGSGESFERMVSAFPITSLNITFNEMDYTTREKLIRR